MKKLAVGALERLHNDCLFPPPTVDQKEGVDFRDHYGWVFYQRNISVPAFMLTQRIMLRFGAVTQYAKVYLNGELLCEHKGGFLPFETEITDKVRPGENLLTVAVDNKVDYSTLPVGSEHGGGYAWRYASRDARRHS